MCGNIYYWSNIIHLKCNILNLPDHNWCQSLSPWVSFQVCPVATVGEYLALLLLQLINTQVVPGERQPQHLSCFQHTLQRDLSHLGCSNIDQFYCSFKSSGIDAVKKNLKVLSGIRITNSVNVNVNDLSDSMSWSSRIRHTCNSLRLENLSKRATAFVILAMFEQRM